MLWKRGRPPDGKYSVRYIDPHDSAVPDVAAQHAIERCQNLVDGSAHESAPEEDGISANEYADVGQHWSTHGYLSAQTPDPAIFYSCGFELELVEQGLGHERELSAGVEPEVKLHSVLANESDHR